MRKLFDLAVVSGLVLFALEKPAQAYIDPGSGSMIMTAILGFIAAIGYTARKYFYKIKNFFCKGRKD